MVAAGFPVVAATSWVAASLGYDDDKRAGATQAELVPDALARGNACLDAGADCVYPIALWEQTRSVSSWQT